MSLTRKLLDIIALIFTVMIALYGLSKGFDFIELSLNITYFIVIIITLIYDISDKKEEMDY